MISFLDDSEAFDTAPVGYAIAAAHKQFTEAKLTEALLARFGKLPSDEEIARHVMCVITHDNVSYYIWVEEKPKVGEKVDLTEPLCVIAPPAIFNPEKP